VTAEWAHRGNAKFLCLQKVRRALAKKAVPIELVSEDPWDSANVTPRRNPLENPPRL